MTRRPSGRLVFSPIRAEIEIPPEMFARGCVICDGAVERGAPVMGMFVFASTRRKAVMARGLICADCEGTAEEMTDALFRAVDD